MLIYLAQPYSNNTEQSFRDAQKFVAIAMEAGYDVFSPVLYFHTVSQQEGMDNRSHDFWMRKCITFLAYCDAAVFLEMDGWDTSKGMDIEYNYCKEVGKHHAWVEARNMDNLCSVMGQLVMRVAHSGQDQFVEE